MIFLFAIKIPNVHVFWIDFWFADKNMSQKITSCHLSAAYFWKWLIQKKRLNRHNGHFEKYILFKAFMACTENEIIWEDFWNMIALPVWINRQRLKTLPLTEKYCLTFIEFYSISKKVHFNNLCWSYETHPSVLSHTIVFLFLFLLEEIYTIM